LPQRQTLAGEPWEHAAIRGGGGVVYGTGPTAGYVDQNAMMPTIVTTSNTSQATYTNAAAVIKQ
jgi:hypothetical protein